MDGRKKRIVGAFGTMVASTLVGMLDLSGLVSVTAFTVAVVAMWWGVATLVSAGEQKSKK